MYNRILKRPMFKRGGSSYQSQGTGITSPYDTPRKRYEDGTTFEDIYSKMREKTRDPRGDWSYAAQGFSELGNPYKDDGSAKTIGEMLYAGAAGVRGSREKAQELERSGELAIQSSKGERLLQEEVVKEEQRQFREEMALKRENLGLEEKKLTQTIESDKARLELQKYLGEIKAKGKKEWLLERLDEHWDSKIASAEAEGKSEEEIAELKALKEKDRYKVYEGYDVSDKYAILRNSRAFEEASDLARMDIVATINPGTGLDWHMDDPGYAAKVIELTNKFLKQFADFLEEEDKIELDATGGRVGRAVGGGMTEDINIKTQTPGGISNINVSETIENDSGKTNEINISYEQLRDRLPPEISDEIVLLLSESYEAFADFAELQTQADVNEFNTKYNVQLFLPQQSGA